MRVGDEIKGKLIVEKKMILKIFERAVTSRDNTSGSKTYRVFPVKFSELLRNTTFFLALFLLVVLKVALSHFDVSCSSSESHSRS